MQRAGPASALVGTRCSNNMQLQPPPPATIYIYIYVAIEQKVIKSKIKANVANRRRKMQREFGQSCL